MNEKADKGGIMGALLIQGFGTIEIKAKNEEQAQRTLTELNGTRININGAVTILSIDYPYNLYEVAPGKWRCYGAHLPLLIAKLPQNASEATKQYLDLSNKIRLPEWGAILDLSGLSYGKGTVTADTVYAHPGEIPGEGGQMAKRSNHDQNA